MAVMSLCICTLVLQLSLGYFSSASAFVAPAGTGLGSVAGRVTTSGPALAGAEHPTCSTSSSSSSSRSSSSSGGRRRSRQRLDSAVVAHSPVIAAAKQPGAADLDWENLGFSWRDTNCHVKYTFRDGAWDEGECVKDPYVKVHIANTAMHYGQAVFEGMKAFQQKDGSVRIFRPQENAERIRNSAKRILMEPPPPELFVEACRRAVQENLEFVPPYGSDGALYIRPLLVGTGARIGLQPSDEYTLLVMVMPVGSYYKGGMGKPATAVVVDKFDRAAPKGVGAAKVAGNYAADMLPNIEAKQAGYPICLYLDAKTNTLVEEFSTSNFFGITADKKKYVTPSSPAVLPSITNKSLMEIAKDRGMVVEKRDIPLEEVESFSEVAACGTAVVMTCIKSIVTEDKVYKLGDGNVGPVCQSLYDEVRAIQNGEAPDPHGWMVEV